jgi:hypothetical protein
MVIVPIDQSKLSIRGEDTDPAAFFETVYQAFQQAEQVVGGSLDRFYSIDSHTIRLRFAGSAVVPHITPALEHLATGPSSDPALTVCLWDSASTDTNIPRPPWSGYAYTPRGDVSGYNNDRIHTAYHVGADVLNLLDTGRDLAIYCTRDARRLPSYETGAPLRTILHWWMRPYRRQFIHGGAVGTANGGVLLTGKGGSGKSTTALACLHSELVYVSDDYCLLAIDPVPYAYSIYNSAKLNPDDICRVPYLRSAISNADRLDTQKALFFLQQHYPEKLVAGFPIRAILLPRVTGRLETTLTPASPMASLRALVPSTMRQLPGADKATLQIIEQFIEQVPSYHLELGTDLVQVPEVIFGLLSEE